MTENTNTTEAKPYIHNISATEVQVGYLNDLAVANSRYREAVMGLRDACDREAGETFWGIGNQTLAEVKKFEGALSALLNLKWILFAVEHVSDEARVAHEEKAGTWIKLALERNERGMFRANQFFKVR